MFGIEAGKISQHAHSVLCSVGKSISKAFVGIARGEKMVTLTVAFNALSGDAKTFQVCLPRRVLTARRKDEPQKAQKARAKARSAVYKAELRSQPFDVVALVVTLKNEAPEDNIFEGAEWACRYKDGLEVPAKVSYDLNQFYYGSPSG